MVNNLNIATTAMPTFHCFPRLPFELRATIWEMTIEPRTVEIRTKRTPTSDYARYSPTPAPSILHACQEAQKIGLKTYQQSFREVLPKDSGRYIWINFNLDTVFLSPDTGFQELATVAPLIKHLKFERENSASYDGEYFYHSESRDLPIFENVEDIYVVCADGLRAWWEATEHHVFPCGAENVYLIHPEDGSVMRALELDEMLDREQEEMFRKYEEEYAASVSAGDANIVD